MSGSLFGAEILRLNRGMGSLGIGPAEDEYIACRRRSPVSSLPRGAELTPNDPCFNQLMASRIEEDERRKQLPGDPYGTLKPMIGPPAWVWEEREERARASSQNTLMWLAIGAVAVVVLGGVFLRGASKPASAGPVA